VDTQSTERVAFEGRARAARIEPYLFVVIEGGRLEAGGMRIALDGIRALAIGRGAVRQLRDGDSGMVLEVPDSRMSGVHARLVRRGGTLLVEDAGSTNGTLVNGDVVTSHALRDGDVEVARAMGKARQQIQRWVRRFGIRPEAYRAR